MRKGILICFIQIRRAVVPLLAVAAFALILYSPPLHAQVLTKPVNLSYLVQRADIIVQGRVTDVTQESLPGYPNVRTVKVTLKVNKMVRGPWGDSFTFREVLLGLKHKQGKSAYTTGQHLLLFLPSASKFGLSSPIGMEQGRFHIGSDSGGSSIVVNELNNAGLFRSVAQDATKAGVNLSANQKRVASTEVGAVRLDDFISLVKNLTSLARIR